MQKKFVLMTLIYYWVKAAPLNTDSLDLNTDITDLKYNTKDLENYIHYLEDDQSNNNKKKSSKKGAKVNYSIEDLKRFFKTLGLNDDGSYDDSESYGLTDSEAAKAVTIKGKENRTYKKGTKTRGFHRIQHKDEYKKDKEFYDDDEVSGSIDKVGSKGFGYNVAKGNDFDKGRFHHVRKMGLSGNQGLSDKGNAEKDLSAYENIFNNYFESDN